MVKVEAIDVFTLGRFNELKNIQRKSLDENGKIFTGDIFECDDDLAKYLLGDNKLGRAFIKVLEVIPEEVKEEVKEVKKTTAKTTKKKNSKKSC